MLADSASKLTKGLIEEFSYFPKLVLETTGSVLLFERNAYSPYADNTKKIYAGKLFYIEDIRLKEDSDHTYYAKVVGVNDDDTEGWVSLNSPKFRIYKQTGTEYTF